MIARTQTSGILVFAFLAIATAASADVPDPTQSSAEPILVGNSNGVLIGNGYRVAVRNVVGNPIPGSSVALIFAGAARPYSAQVAPATSNCAVPSINKSTDAAGNVTFQPRFGGFANAPAVQVRADGILIRTVPARSTDLNADGATAIGDLGIFRINFIFSPGNLETDYNESGATEIGDLDIFRKAFLFDTPGTPCP